MTSPIKVYVYVHTHWDREWYRTFQQYRLRLIETIDLVLDQLDNKELEYFTLDGQSIVLNDYIEVKPQNADRLINYIKQGNIEVGPWYVLPDEFLVSGESIVQNLYLGHKICNSFGGTSKVGYIPDTFGHSIDIPLIMNKFNIDNAVIWRGVNTQGTEFKWYSLDKSNVKTYHLLNGYYTSFFDKEENYDINQKVCLIKEFLDKIKNKTRLDCILMPVGGDHNPPPGNISAQINEINNAQSEYYLIQSTLSKFIETIDPDKLEEHIQQEFRDCTNTFILPAVYSSRLYLKQDNAKLTHLINGIIEPLTCYCNLLKLDNFQLPDSEYLWKLLIENHPHDSICGCSIDEVHKEMEQRYKQLQQACCEVVNRAKWAITKNLPKENIAVYNTSSYPFTGPVELNLHYDLNLELPNQLLEEFEDRHFTTYSNLDIARPATIIKKQTNCLIWASNIPPHSLKTIKPTEIPNPVKDNNGILTNGIIEIQVNSDSITITDLQNNREYTGINQIIDRLDCGDSYNYGPVKNNTPITASIIKHHIKESGPIRGTIELIYQIDIPESLNETRNRPASNIIHHIITCNVSITANSKLVEFNLTWENKSKDHILQVKFPMENDIYTTLVENHFSTFERYFDPSYNIYEHIPAKEQTELKTNTAPMQRFVQANDWALFAEGLPEYEVYKNNLYLTILRSTGYLSRNDITTRGAYAGPELQTPDNQCIRTTTAHYAIHPKTSVSNLYLLAERFMGCTVSIAGESTSKDTLNLEHKLIGWENPNIISTHYSFDSNTQSIILHILNISSYPQHVTFNSTLNINSITEINFLKEPIGEPLTKPEVILTPHELKALQINYLN